MVDPNTHNNKLATYHSWFAIPFSRNDRMPTIRGNEGKNRHGIAVLVAPSCSDNVRALKTSENAQCIWMQCDKKMFGLEEDVIVDAAYINPQSRDLFPVRAHSNSLTCLRTRLVLFRCLLMSYCVLTPMWGS